MVNLSAVAGASNMHAMHKSAQMGGKILFSILLEKNIFRETDFEAEF